MATTKARATKKAVKVNKNGKPSVAESAEVLTLAEAAAYLRVAIADVLDAVKSRGLPARQIGAEWRFCKSSLLEWLRTPQKDAIQSVIGNWKDDPYLEQELREIYQRRGRPMTEDGE